MSELYKRSDSKFYWYTLGEGKNRIRRSTKCMDLDDALRVQKLWDEEYIDKVVYKKVKCRHLILTYLSQLETRKSTGWFKRICSGLGNFKLKYGDMYVCDITIEILDDYMRLRESVVAPKTILEEIKMLNNFFKWSKARSYIEHNPCTDLVMPKVVRVRTTRAFTKPELKLLFETNHKKDYLLWNILFYTGIRVSDALSLDDSNIYDDRIKCIQTKTSNEVVVPIHKSLKPLLINGFETDLMKYGAIGRSRERIKLVAKDCNIHTFRHTFATYLENYCDASRFDIKALLGHKSNDVTANYIHKNFDHLKTLINRLSFH